MRFFIFHIIVAARLEDHLNGPFSFLHLNYHSLRNILKMYYCLFMCVYIYEKNKKISSIQFASTMEDHLCKSNIIKDLIFSFVKPQMSYILN